MMNAAQVAIARWVSTQTPESLYNVLWILSRMFTTSSGGSGDSDITNWTTYNVDEETGTDETIAANPLRGQPGAPFRTIAFAIAQFAATYPLANDYDVWANQKFIIHLGAGRFTTAVQGASIDLPLLRRTTMVTGFGAVVESEIVIQNDKALAPDGNAFNSALLPAPWSGSTYGQMIGIEFVGLGSVDVRSGDDMPGLTFLGQISLETLAAVGQTLQPKVQFVRSWVNNGFHALGANLSQTEIPLYAEGSAFGTAPTFGSTPTVVGCDGPPGLSAVSLLLSAKRSVFYDRIGPFATFGDVEDCYFDAIRNDLDFASAPIAGVIASANDGGFYNCTFVNPGRGDYGFVMGTSAEVSPLPFRADDNSLVSIAGQLPTFDHMQSVGLDVSDLLQTYVGPTGSDVVSAPGISAVPYASIGAAMATATDGTIIHVAPGSYASSAQWPAIAHLSIVGEDASSTVIFANDDAQPALRIENAAARGGRIANITFEKTGATTTVGCVHVDNTTSDPDFIADGLLIENCVAERNQPGGAGAGLYYAWYINGASKVTLRGCSGGITDTLNADLHAYDCEIYAQGDVPNALTVTGPVLGTLTRAWTGSRYHGCEIKGDVASGTPGVRIGATPWIELDAGCVVSDSIQSLSDIVDANAGAQVPRIISRARFEPSNAHAMTFACTTTPAIVDLDDSDFVSDGGATATLTLEATAGTPRQPVSLRNGTLSTLALGSKLDATVLGTQLVTLTATLAATGSTCDRTQHVTRATLDGGGGALLINIIPWPTGINVEVITSCESVVTVLPIGASFSGLAGPSGGGTVALNGTVAAAGLDVGVMMVRRSP
jgi:hypothetical protein